MAVYPIKLLKDESGQPFVPLTSVEAIYGDKNLQYILNVTQVSNGHFKVECKGLTLKDATNSAIAVRWPEITTVVKPSYLQLNDEAEKAIYAPDGTNYLDLEDSTDVVNFVAYDGSKWVLIGNASTGSGGHVITDGEGNTMEQQKILNFVGFNVENDNTNRATKIINPTPINNLNTTTSGQGPLDAYQGHVLNSKFSDLAAVASTGSYTDLTDKPTLFSGSYTDLTNRPTIPGVINNLTSTSTTDALSASQGKILNDKTDPHFTEIHSTKVITAKTLRNGYASGSYMDSVLRNKTGVGNNMTEFYGGIHIPNIENYSVFIVELNCGGHTSGSSSQFDGGIVLYKGVKGEVDSQYGDDWQNTILAPSTTNYWKGVITKIIYVGDRTGPYVIGSVWDTYSGADFQWNTGFGDAGSTLRVVGFLK